MPTIDEFVPSLVKWSEVFMHSSMRNFIQYSAKSGLSRSQIGALFWLYHKGNCAVSDIGEELGITNAAASQMLERLVQMGLIQRTEDPHDRRYKQIVLTEQGRQVIQESIDARRSWFASLADTLSDSEKEQIVSALNILVETASRLYPNVE
jgi:DNA-binding MarR family transcriptional regulator